MEGILKNEALIWGRSEGSKKQLCRREKSANNLLSCVGHEGNTERCG